MIGKIAYHVLRPPHSQLAYHLCCLAIHLYDDPLASIGDDGTLPIASSPIAGRSGSICRHPDVWCCAPLALALLVDSYCLHGFRDPDPSGDLTTHRHASQRESGLV